MERNIDSMGRIVIPSEFRKQLRINDGDLLNLDINNNSIVVTKVNNTPSDIRRVSIIKYDESRLKSLREKYPEGTMVECIDMADPYKPIPTGTHGVVWFIDDIGSIHVKWENGSTLALIENEDRFKIIK